MIKDKPATIEELTALWLEEKSRQLIPSSLATYYHTVAKYIVPLIGDLRLDSLSRSRLQEFVNQLFTLGLSEKTVWDVNVKLNASLHWAVDRGFIDHAGYCIKTRFHLPDKPRTLSERECGVLETYLSEADRVKIGILLCLKCGIMVGELCALLHSDLDRDAGVLIIDKRMQRIVDVTQRTGRKTRVETFPVERRAVPVERRIMALIGRLPPAAPDSYFLTGRTDKCLEPRTIQMRLKRSLNHCGLGSDIDFNVLKATYISSTLNRGVDLCTVGKLVGAKRLSHISDKYRAFSYDRTTEIVGNTWTRRD